MFRFTLTELLFLLSPLSSLNIQFITHDGAVNVLRNLYDKYKNIDLFSPIVIGNNVFLGYNVTILPNTVIGNNVIVGTGSICKGNLKNNSIYAGVPAKYICSVSEYIEKNKNKFIETKHLSSNDKIEFINSWIKKNGGHFDV